MSREPKKSINSTTSSTKDSTTSRSSNDGTALTESNAGTNCHLCPNGQRPTRPDAIVKGFSWTCDELDAAIPVLYTQPQLLFFSATDVAPCEDYRASFGEICGCPAAEDELTDVSSSRPTSKSIGNSKKMTRYGMVGLVWPLLLLALISLFIRRRASLGRL